MREAFLLAGYSPEDSKKISPEVFLLLIRQSVDLRDFFSSPPVPEQHKIFMEDYTKFAREYNHGNRSLSHFRVPADAEKLPESFLELAEIISGKQGIRDTGKAWNYIHGFLQKNVVAGIYQEEAISPSLDNVILSIQGLIHVLSEEKEIDNSSIDGINQSLRKINSTLGNTNKGLKSGNPHKEFDQLTSRILDTKVRGKNALPTAEYLHDILAILGASK